MSSSLWARERPYADEWGGGMSAGRTAGPFVRQCGQRMTA